MNAALAIVEGFLPIIAILLCLCAIAWLMDRL